MSDKIKVTLSPQSLQVEAGGEPATIFATVRNLGDIVDRFSIQVGGLDPSWFKLSATSVSLFPQDSGDVQIKFQVPRKEGVKAGAYPFTIIATSESMAQEYTSVQGTLEVRPFAQFELDMRPTRATCRCKAYYRVILVNSGISDLSLNLKAVDVEEGCQFRFKPNNPRLAAWAKLEVKMQVKPKQRPLSGSEKRYEFTVTATPEGKREGKSTRGEVIHRPLVSSWRPLWTLLKLAIAGTIIYFLLQIGGGWKVLFSQPQQWVDNVVRFFQGWLPK